MANESDRIEIAPQSPQQPSLPCNNGMDTNYTLCDTVLNNTTGLGEGGSGGDTSGVYWEMAATNTNSSSGGGLIFPGGFDVNLSSYYIQDGTINDSNASLGDVNGSHVTSQSASAHSLLSDEFRVSLITFYTVTTIFAIVGNILVVIVFAHGRRCRTDIRPFLINLAVADLILAIFCMPFTFTFAMIRNWIFSAPMCPIVLFMQHLSVSASVFTNMAIGIDRFLVVTFPLKARRTTRRAKYSIAVIWLCSLGLSSVQLVVARAVEYPSSVDCDERWDSKDQRMTFTISVLFITYIVPLVILSVTYSIVSVIMWKRTTPGNAHEGRDLKQLRAKRKVIKMLVLIVIMFALCWLPLHTFFLVLDFNPQITMDSRVSVKRQITIIFYVVHWLAMSNSCANPIIYGFMNDSFRADLAALCYVFFPFCQCLKRVANRRFSMSTNMDSNAYHKRFSTVRRCPLSSPSALYHQQQKSPTKLGYGSSKIYIELKRERNVGSMNDFFPDASSSERFARDTNSSASPSSPSPSSSSFSVATSGCRRPRRPQSYLRQESVDGNVELTDSLQNNSSCDGRLANCPMIPKGQIIVNSDTDGIIVKNGSTIKTTTTNTNTNTTCSNDSNSVVKKPNNHYLSGRPCSKPDFNSNESSLNAHRSL